MVIKIKDSINYVGSQVKHLFKPSFLASKNSSVSLDIGSAYVKAISLEKDAQSFNITGFSCEKTEPDIKNTIKKALSKLPIKKRDLAISISGHSVVLRYVNMPIMNYEEFVKSMSFELEKYIPFNKDEINFDFSILKKNKNTGKMLVLIAAAKKDLVEKRMSLCKDLGYQPVFVDVCPLALANYFEFTRQPSMEEVCAVINLGSSISSVDIIEDGQLVLSRDIFIGGHDFTKSISELRGKSMEESESIKLNSINEEIIQHLEPIYNNLIKEIKTSFDFYETQANRVIEKIICTGGAVHLKNLMESFKQNLGQDVSILTFNPDKLPLIPSLNEEEFRNKFNFLTIALGIALRGI
jgi:type IV pilus assembly protein PilM